MTGSYERGADFVPLYIHEHPHGLLHIRDAFDWREKVKKPEPYQATIVFSTPQL